MQSEPKRWSPKAVVWNIHCRIDGCMFNLECTTIHIWTKVSFSASNAGLFHRMHDKWGSFFTLSIMLFQQTTNHLDFALWQSEPIFPADNETALGYIQFYLFVPLLIWWQLCKVFAEILISAIHACSLLSSLLLRRFPFQLYYARLQKTVLRDHLRGIVWEGSSLFPKHFRYNEGLNIQFWRGLLTAVPVIPKFCKRHGHDMTHSLRKCADMWHTGSKSKNLFLQPFSHVVAFGCVFLMSHASLNVAELTLAPSSHWDLYFKLTDWSSPVWLAWPPGTTSMISVINYIHFYTCMCIFAPQSSHCQLDGLMLLHHRVTYLFLSSGICWWQPWIPSLTFISNTIMTNMGLMLTLSDWARWEQKDLWHSLERRPSCFMFLSCMLFSTDLFGMIKAQKKRIHIFHRSLEDPWPLWFPFTKISWARF